MIYKKKKKCFKSLSFENFERPHELSDLNLKILSQPICNIYSYEKLLNDGNRTILLYLEAFPRDLAISFSFFLSPYILLYIHFLAYITSLISARCFS